MRKKLPLTIFASIAVFVAFICAFIAIGFRYLIFGFNEIFLVKSKDFFGIFGDYIFIFIPAIGGLIVGLLIYKFAREAKGHGVPEVMAAVATNEGRIRARVIAVKAFASSICIGSGGSAGREGPIVQMGATTGSLIAQKLNLTPYQIKILVACGATAGISATFNTPIAAVLFSLELILREFKTRSFIPIVISSVIATIVSRYLLELLNVSEKFIFNVPEYTLETPIEIMFYLPLGIVTGLVAIFYVKSLYSFEDFFDKIQIPDYVKPAIGGICVGIIGFILLKYTGSFYIFGVGYDSIDLIFAGSLTFFILFALIFLKIFATSLTLGSGGSGGVFAPSLFIGAMTGGTYGYVVHTMFPAITANLQAYAIVGMAAVFAGCSRATLTAILIVFEMTGNYAIILPLMFACVISDAVGVHGLKNESIYTIKLRRRGINILHDMDVNSMEARTVKEIMSRNVKKTKKDVLITDLFEQIKRTNIQAYPVVDNNDKLVGIITRTDIKDAMIRGEKDITVDKIMSTNIISVNPDETLDDAINKMRKNHLSRLPVVDINNKSKVIGIITRGDILRAHQEF